MEKEELLKCLAPYLPYDLKIYHSGGKVLPLQIDRQEDWTNDGFNLNELINYHYLEPILKPLSDLSNEVDDLTKGTIQFLSEAAKLPYNSDDLLLEGLMYADMKILLENHYDVFRLIEKSYAKDINTVRV